MIDAIPYFERYLNYMKKILSQEELYFHLGDWMGYSNSKKIPKRFVHEFYQIKALKITAFAHTLTHSGDTRWEQALADATNAFTAQYLDGDGRCVIAEQSSIAMMLEMGLYYDRDVLAKQLIEVVERDGRSLTCGMVGVQYLYDALAHSGRADLAYKMITESEPGYRTWYRHGATTLWERWAGEDDGSHNHHMFSGVIAWFYKYLLGIVPMEEAPAFERIELCPCFVEDAGFVRGRMETVRGVIEAEWRFEDGEIHYTVTIPNGVHAIFRGQVLQEGQNKFRVFKEASAV